MPGFAHAQVPFVTSERVRHRDLHHAASNDIDGDQRDRVTVVRVSFPRIKASPLEVAGIEQRRTETGT